MDQTIIISFLIKGGIAFLCGFFIGLERELKGSSAGLRTSVLICIGSALFTALGYEISKGVGDPTRVFAQIVSGVGFLGAGVILQSNGAILGLTTATTIWITSAVGVAVGVGYEIVAVLFTVATLGTLIGLKYFQTYIIHTSGIMKKNYTCDIVVKMTTYPMTLEHIINRAEGFGLVIVHKGLDKSELEFKFRLKYQASRQHNLDFLKSLEADKRIVRFEVV